MNRVAYLMSILGLATALGLGVNFAPALTAEHAGEHPGGETEQYGQHSGEEQPGDHGEQSKHQDVTFSASEIQTAIKDYIRNDQSLKNGYFFIHDNKLTYAWKLTFSKLHPVRVINRDGKKIYFACTNFMVKNDTDQYKKLDIDFWMKPEDGELEPYKIRIHKVDGKARFTYQDDRPVET